MLVLTDSSLYGKNGTQMPALSLSKGRWFNWLTQIRSYLAETDSTFASPTCPSWSVDVGIDFFGGFELNNEIDFGDIEASCCNIGGNQAFEISCLEALEGNFSLLLRNISMKHLSFLLEVGLEEDLVCFLFSLTKDDCPAMPTSVEIDHISNNWVSVVVGAVQGQVVNCLRCSNFGVLDELNEVPFGREVEPAKL